MLHITKLGDGSQTLCGIIAAQTATVNFSQRKLVNETKICPACEDEYNAQCRDLFHDSLTS